MDRGKRKKPSNRSRILECIYRNAPVSRTEIAEGTDITPATVTANVTALLGERAVKELEEACPEDSPAGRRRVPLDIEPSYAYAAGAEFTQKGLVACVTDLKGRVLREAWEPFGDGLAARITEAVIKSIRGLIRDLGISWDSVAGIGIAVPGHMDAEQSVLVTNRTTWSGFAPGRIQDAFPVPVVFENNARCMALAEYLFDPGESPDSFAFLHVGMGMFCASMVEGELFLGNHYVAGEIGHTIVNEGGRRCECGKYGCLQTYCSENWLLRQAGLLYENSGSTLLKSLVREKDEITIQTVATAYSMGDPVIGGYIRDALKYLGITVSNIAIIMNPGKIFLHGQMFGNEDICLELKDYIERQLLFVDSTYADNITILPYSREDGAVGGCALAVSRFFIQSPA